MSLDATAIDRVVELAHDPLATLTDDRTGLKYTDSELSLLSRPHATALEINTLCGIRDYLNSGIDKRPNDQIICNVLDRRTVMVFGTLDDEEKRSHYISAKFKCTDYSFGLWMTQEDFIIALQTRFVTTPDLEKILLIASNVSDATVANFADDGLCQQVTVKVGVAKVANTELPGIVQLRPFRTFPDVEQPLSSFRLRARKGRSDAAPEFAIFEADGGKWEIDAIQTIAAWLKANITTEITILA